VPSGWIILGLCAIARSAPRSVVHRQHSQAEPCDLPLHQVRRPWVGGIEGWSINDLVGVVNNKAMQFVADEIFPLIDAWKAFHGYPAQIPPLLSLLGPVCSISANSRKDSSESTAIRSEQCQTSGKPSHKPKLTD